MIIQFAGGDGTTTIDPDGSGPRFKTPIAGPLPEDLWFIPWGSVPPAASPGS